MGEPANCEDNYSEPPTQCTTPASIRLLRRLRRAAVRIVLGKLWEGSR